MIRHLMDEIRVLVLLLYLNKNWSPNMNGELELWSKDMKQCVKRIAPIFNRLIIFRITQEFLLQVKFLII